MTTPPASSGLTSAGTTSAPAGSITYTVNCGGRSRVWRRYYVVNDGGTQFAPGTWVRSTLPIASTPWLGGRPPVSRRRTSTSRFPPVALTPTTGSTCPSARSGPWHRAGTPLRALGPVSDERYFDVNRNGESFGWTSNPVQHHARHLRLGPTSVGGTLTVTGSSTGLFPTSAPTWPATRRTASRLTTLGQAAMFGRRLVVRARRREYRFAWTQFDARVGEALIRAA